jgi:hypothetical protein
VSFDPAMAASAAMPQPTVMEAGYNASLTDAVQFQNALQTAGSSAPSGVGGTEALEPVMKGMMKQLDQINTQANDLAVQANAAEAKGSAMSPGEMIQMTVRCHEFMFNCQLTSNIANRTSDGFQQLFRQQA